MRGLTMKKNTALQQGIGLIEVLVTVLLLATALLVVASLQMRSLQYNQGAYLRSQANILAYDIIDRMRLNRRNIVNYSLDFSSAKPTGTTLASVDMKEWMTNLETIMPNGQGKIVCSSSGKCNISIKWAELKGAGEGVGDTSTFSFSTQI